jgi:multisubunit Na+/H+ antiporter MnhB subunit
MSETSPQEAVLRSVSTEKGKAPIGNLWRSIIAVIVGMVVGVAVTLLTDIVLHVVHVFPPWGQPVSDAPLALATIYRVIYSVFGSYLIARLAPRRPLKHALIGGFVGLLVSLAGAIATWNSGPAFGPHWYPIALVVTALPCAWFGGKLRVMQVAGQSRSAAATAK